MKPWSKIRHKVSCLACCPCLAELASLAKTGQFQRLNIPLLVFCSCKNEANNEHGSEFKGQFYSAHPSLNTGSTLTKAAKEVSAVAPQRWVPQSQKQSSPGLEDYHSNRPSYESLTSKVRTRIYSVHVYKCTCIQMYLMFDEMSSNKIIM